MIITAGAGIVLGFIVGFIVLLIIETESNGENVNNTDQTWKCVVFIALKCD